MRPLRIVSARNAGSDRTITGGSATGFDPVCWEDDVGFGDGTVGDEEPESEDRLGEDVEDGVDEDFDVG